MDRANLQKEVASLSSEIDRIAESANFNGIKLLNGDLGAVKDKEVTGVKGSQAINTGIEVGKAVDGYGVTGEFSFDMKGLFGDGDSITIKGTKGDGTAFTKKDYGTAIAGEEAKDGEIKVHFGAGGIEGDTKEAQANALYQKLLTNTELTDSFDITVDGTKVTMKAKQEGAPSITGGGPQGIGNITDVTTNNKEVSIATASTDKRDNVLNSTDANGLPKDATKLTNAGVNNIITSATDYQEGDILEFKFKVDGTDVTAKVELTADMIAKAHMNTEDGTQAIVDALKNANFADVEGTNIDESKYKVGDYFDITANKNAGGFAEAGSLMIEGKAAGALTFKGATKAGIAAGTSVNGTAGTNGGNVTTGSTGAIITVGLQDMTLTVAEQQAGVDFGFMDSERINIIDADASATEDRVYTKKELVDIMRGQIGTNFKTNADTSVTLRDVDEHGNLIFEKTKAETTGDTLDNQTTGITLSDIKFVQKTTTTSIATTGVDTTTAAAGTASTKAVGATATFKITDGITGRNTADAINLEISGKKLELVAANAGKADYSEDELLELLSEKIGTGTIGDTTTGTWTLESIGSDGTVTLRQTTEKTGETIDKSGLNANTLKISDGTHAATLEEAAITAGVSADAMMESNQVADNRYHSVTKFGVTGGENDKNATNFSVGDKFAMSGVLSDGTKFELELVAGTHFDIGATKEDTLNNIKKVLTEGQNGSGTSLEAVNVKLTSTNGDKTTEKEVSSKTLFGVGGEFTIYANQEKFAGVTGEKGDFIVSSNKAGQVANTDPDTGSIVGTSGGAIQVSVTPVDEAKLDFAGSAGSAQTAARASIQFKEGVEYGSAMSFNGKVYEFVAKAEDISDTNNTAIVVEDLANASADDIAEQVKNALGQDFGDQYNFETINGKLNISSKEIGSKVTAPEIKLINGTEINTASYKFNPDDIKVGKQFTLNAKTNADGKLEGGQTFEFYQKGAAPVEPKEGVTYIGMDFKDPEAMTSEKIAQAVNDAVESDTALSGKMAIDVGEDGTMTVSSKVITDGKFEDASFHMVVDGEGGGLTLQIGETSEDFQKVTVAIDKMDAKSLGIGDISVGKQPDAAAAIDKIKDAINKVSSTRGDLGAIQNRLEHTINNLGVTTENMTAAESRIRDTDMAKEMMEFTKNNILVQASQAMLAQANQLPQGVLQLLQ